MVGDEHEWRFRYCPVGIFVVDDQTAANARCRSDGRSTCFVLVQVLVATAPNASSLLLRCSTTKPL